MSRRSSGPISRPSRRSAGDSSRPLVCPQRGYSAARTTTLALSVRKTKAARARVGRPTLRRAGGRTVLQGASDAFPYCLNDAAADAEPTAGS